MTTLTLGTVTFAGFEIPERINFGGSQRITLHRIVGGDRALDTTGFDPKDPSWSGRFRGSSALDRARAVQQMCEAGLPVSLSWDTITYSVVIADFEANYERSYEIPYRISCIVAAQPTAASSPTVDSLVSQDSSTLGSLVSSITGAVSSATTAVGSEIASVQSAVAGALSPITSALAPITGNLGQASAIIAQFGSIAGFSVGQLAPLTTALNQAQGGFTGLATIASGQIFTGTGQIGGVLPSNPQGGLPAMLTQVANLQTTANALIARGTAGRLLNNVASAGATN